MASGNTIIPAKKNLMPANCIGVVYCNPIFTPAKADDQRRQDIMARMAVFLLLDKLYLNCGRSPLPLFDFKAYKVALFDIINKVVDVNEYALTSG